MIRMELEMKFYIRAPKSFSEINIAELNFFHWALPWQVKVLYQ